MKKLILITGVLISVNCWGQRIALLDTKFKQPIIFTDSVTVEQTTSGYFPVSVENFDTLYADISYLKEMLSVRQRAKMKSFELRAGSTTVTVKRVPYPYGDRYVSIAKTRVNNLNAQYILLNNNFSNKDNGEKLGKIMAYMKRNKELFKSPNEVMPKIYNVVTISD